MQNSRPAGCKIYTEGGGWRSWGITKEDWGERPGQVQGLALFFPAFTNERILLCTHVTEAVT